MHANTQCPPYWKWEAGLPPDLLRCAVEEMNTLPLEPGRLLGDREAGRRVRHSDVCMLPPVHWLCGILYNYAMHANMAAGWNRRTTTPQTVQFARYDVGQHYDWHVDTDILSAQPWARKLTAICLLSARSEFDGGDLEIEHCDTPVPMDAGTVVVFPSLLRHRVTPITRGQRKSATCWVLGEASW